MLTHTHKESFGQAFSKLVAYRLRYADPNACALVALRVRAKSSMRPQAPRGVNFDGVERGERTRGGSP